MVNLLYMESGQKSQVAYDVVFQLDYVAGPQLNTTILQLGARFAVDLR